MENKIRNMLASMLMMVFLAAPSLLWLSQQAFQLDLPVFLTAQDAFYLSGSHETIDLQENLNLADFQNKELQSSFEKVINSNVPLQACAILTPAAIQRRAIEASNLVFKWDAFPTYYGSKDVFSPAYNTIRKMPASSKSSVLKGMREFGGQLAAFAKKNPDIKICIVLPSSGPYDPSIPSWDYTSDNCSANECVDALEEQLDGISNAFVASSPPYNEYSEYLEQNYYCDHHWNGYGAISLYNEAALKMQLPAISPAPEKVDYLDLYGFYGQNGRDGRMLIDTVGTLNEPAFDTSSLILSRNLMKARMLVGDTIPQSEPPIASYSFYEWFYGGSLDVSITNLRSPNEDVTLMVCDSFGDAFRWAVAPNCKKLHTLGDLFYTDKTAIGLQDHLNETSASKVFFVGSISDYSSFTERHPEYFQTPS